MKGLVRKTLTAFAVSQLVFGCAVLKEGQPPTGTSPIEDNRVSQALASLRDLEQVDVYIKLNNNPLRKRIQDELKARASETTDFQITRIRVRFARQVIAIEATMQIANGFDEPLGAKLNGDAILTFSGNQLNWLPRFDRLKVSDSGFEFEGQTYSEATGELEDMLLQRVNSEVADAVIVAGRNVVQINPLPLGQIEVGAALTNFPGVASTSTHALGGVFTVTNSSILVERGTTSIAADLGFIPNISDCPADLQVSRSTFASQIINREPVGITRLLDEKIAVSHFFTEISGATRPTAVVHYWFADGKPVELEELPVEPSYRWRTWSSMSIDPKLASNWEVIVVEKETGCILHSLAIRTDPAIRPVPEEPATDPASFSTFREEFEQRVSGFSILGERPDIALIEIPLPFLRDALHASLKDIQIVVDIDTGDLPTQRLSGSLQPFSDADIVCSERECRALRECDSGFTQCTRQRDTRDCTTCLFRNPLNNRCINEGIDPICEAARTAQNVRYERARSACLEREATAGQDCERLRSQEIRSCEIEAESRRSACEAGREMVQDYSDAGAFAGVFLDMKTTGRFTAVYSEFEIEGDLERIRQSLDFGAALKLSGTIRFAPKTELGPLAVCMNAWQKSFDGIVVLPQLANNMIGTIVPTQTALVTTWTGQVVTASISPSPLEAMFVENPNLLANCHIGLTVGKVAASITGANSEYVAGRYPFEIQPSPSRIDLATASVVFGDKVFKAMPELSSTHLKYEVRD